MSPSSRVWELLRGCVKHTDDALKVLVMTVSDTKSCMQEITWDICKLYHNGTCRGTGYNRKIPKLCSEEI